MASAMRAACGASNGNTLWRVRVPAHVVRYGIGDLCCRNHYLVAK
jgi:hypothetical protein